MSSSQIVASATALAATLAFSCHDRDTIWIAPGVGGSAGQGGAGGSGQGGSNLGGAAGSSVGGSSGSGAGGSAGSAGSSAGSGGSGQAGTQNMPPTDAGPDADAPESGVSQPLTQQQAAEAICARLDDVPSCQAPLATCVDDTIAGWNFFKDTAFPPACSAVVDAHFNCMALEPVTSFDCAGQDSNPQFFTPQTGNCTSPDAEYQRLFSESDPNPCLSQ